MKIAAARASLMAVALPCTRQPGQQGQHVIRGKQAWQAARQHVRKQAWQAACPTSATALAEAWAWASPPSDEAMA